MSKRWNYSAAFKAKIALEALRGDAMVAVLASRHKVHPNLITNWKRRASKGMVDVFSYKQSGRDGTREAEIKKLHAKFSELTIEKGCVARRFALCPKPSVAEPQPEDGDG